MISVLVVEDDSVKYGRIHRALSDVGIPSQDIDHVITSADAFEKLKNRRFDLLLLDVNIPRRLGENPVRGGGLEFLRDLRRGTNAILPRYVVGVTAYDDVVKEFGEQFADQLWSLVYYSENSDHWVAQISTKVQYIQAAKASDFFSDGVTYGTDLAVVCALEGVELDAVKSLPCGWQPLKFPQDETKYLIGSIESGGQSCSVVAAGASRMGMPAAAVLSGKIIAQFRPRILAMVGICAGRVEKTNIGDVIIADPCWDWGSGKIDSHRNQPRFRPSPHQLELDTDLAAILKECCSDVSLLARIKSEARGKRPNTELRAHFGPLASGAVVVSNKSVFDTLLDQHRNLLGIEMEAYGAALACKGMGKPRPVSLIMKAVSDYADKDKVDDFQEYAAHTSALLLYHSAKEFLKSTVAQRADA
jgi:nucleoside phosphorylase/CheY-like chemotaxis protein